MIEDKLEQLEQMDTKELKLLYLEYFNKPSARTSKQYYISKIAYRMQELEYGGLPSKTRLFLTQMYKQPSNLGKKETIAPIGTHIIKTYKGKEYDVKIINNGFDVNGKIYKTLSGIAKSITGQKISGALFFGLNKMAAK